MVAACATVLVAVGVLAIAGVFSSGSADSATTASTTSTDTNATAGNVQGFPLLPIVAANSQVQGAAKLAKDGSFEDSIPIPTALQSILPNVQVVAITLAENQKVEKAIQVARQQKQALLTVQGKMDFIGVV